jgi:hypothetical protein
MNLSKGEQRERGAFFVEATGRRQGVPGGVIDVLLPAGQSARYDSEDPPGLAPDTASECAIAGELRQQGER